ncbi:hypothetical protein M2651_08835 [Clostridium sp. SYSU_GA19001]|uniref:hypothetical protein n=1 Tax=Clostridium caldaquaticum TaxID=2940653 RepID=UPI0020773618|nr:hypothetical protein [Clostridium caldaquaticum]MCM8711132.1 hypothetical protein [Clostridium caldaquaticum]
MRENYDLVEDVRDNKNNFLFIKAFSRIVIAALIFVMLCGICFNIVYSYMFEKIKIAEENSKLEANENRKSYLVEQKLIKYLQNKENNDINKE